MKSLNLEERPVPSKVPKPTIIPDPQIPGVVPRLIPEVEPDRTAEIPEKDTQPECVPESSPDASPVPPSTPEVQPVHDESTAVRVYAELRTRAQAKGHDQSMNRVCRPNPSGVQEHATRVKNHEVISLVREGENVTYDSK